MFMLTQPANNILLNHLANIRLRQRNTAVLGNGSFANNHELNLKRTYARVFAGLSQKQIGQITKEAIFLRPLRNDALSTILFLPSSNLLWRLNVSALGVREFHSHSPRKTTTSFGIRIKPEDNTSPWKSWLQSAKSGKIHTYEEYKAEVDKLEDGAKKAYNEGFIRAIYAGGLGKKETGEDLGLFALFWRTIKRTIVLFGMLTLAFYTAKFVFRKILGGDVIMEFTNRGVSFSMENEVNVTFDDVCGIDEAKLELQEVVDYLREPDKYTRLGARLPKGVLLVGPPGTGKTLLARAIAGEANVPFFHSSGSEFDEVLVGQGAKRVRELFKKAKEKAPCVVFIDEIDSVGAKRTSSSLHPYANQTINQLLSEMDGFVQNEGVIVIGATNKKEHLDSALLRPGRFDVQVHVPIPDLAGRKEIFQLYLDKIIHDDQCDSSKLARGTYGFTGAGIENMVNQAALKAASEGLKMVTMRQLDEARDRIMMGPARLKGRHPDEQANRNTAYHEAGHAIVAMFTKNTHPLHKVTIIPRGGSLGHTAQLPEKDELQKTKAQILAELDVCMGGRVAEELIFGEENVTTGASSDLKHATALAESMVKMFGMSGKVGLRDFTSPAEDRELGAFGRGPHTSDEIDAEIRRVMQESYERAKELLVQYKTEHRLLAEALLEYETLNKQEVERVIKGEKLKKMTTMNQQVKGSGAGKKRKQPQTVTFFPDRTATD